MRYNYMICPAHDLGVNVFSNVQCEPNPVFQWQRYTWPDFMKITVSLKRCDRLLRLLLTTVFV
jgi:phosphatidate cytidylyltransferase